MNKEIISLIIVGVVVIALIIQTIFRMKFKKDMFVEYLKHYEDGTAYLSDDVIKKLFNIESEE